MCYKIPVLVVLAALMVTSLAYAGDLEFTACPFPSSDQQKRVVRTSPSATVDGQPTTIGFHTIFRSGDKGVQGRHSGVFGQLVDQKGDVLTAEDGSTYISNDNDFSGSR